MSLFKRFALWLTFIAIGVCFFNWLGHDDKNILLYLINVPNFLYYLVGSFYEPFKLFAMYDLYLKVYLITILYWLFIGLIVDIAFIKLKKWSKTKQGY
jgi:hypothetical protein